MKAYLGDGVYIQEGAWGGQLLLTTEDGINVQNRVFMEKGEVLAMVKWVVESGLINAEDLPGGKNAQG